MKTKILLYVISITIGTAILGDTILTALTLGSMFRADNAFSIIFVITSGIFITGIVVSTKQVWSSKSHWALKAFWIIAALIDGYTNIIGAIYYLIMHNALDKAPDLNAIRFDPTNIPSSFVVFGLTFVLTSASVFAQYILEKFTE